MATEPMQSDLDRERQFHIDERTAELEAAGWAPDAARFEAERRFGAPRFDPPAPTERRWSISFDNLWRDVRFACRSLRRNTAFTTFAVLIVGLGIGASATVFSVVNTLILRPLPFADPGRLVWIANRETGGMSAQTTQVAHMLDLRARTQTMSAIAGYFAFYGVGDNLLTGVGEPERLSGVPVSENFFDVLGVRPALGRPFTADEVRWQGPPAVILTHGLWQRRFASDPGVIGMTIVLNDTSHLVVGVMPASFDFGSVFAPGNRFDLLLPFPLTLETSRWGNTMAMIGRLRPGVSVETARAEVRVLGEELTRANKDRNRFVGAVTPLADHVSGRMRMALWVLSGAVAAVMLIVCANLSNLLLARTASRQKEMAIRAAMGAGRGRLVTQMLTEGVVLSLGGALLGVALASAGTGALAQQRAVSIPLLSDVQLDWTTLGFAMAMAVATGLLFGLAPALQAPALALHGALKDSSRGATEGRERRWVRSALVVAEMAFACVLLVGAGLLVRSFVHVLDVDLGFDPTRASTVRVDPDTRVATPAQTDAYLADVLRLVRGIPGVEAAGYTDALPFGRNRTWGVRKEGETDPNEVTSSAFIRLISDGYFDAMSIPLVAGRDLTAFDTARSERVAIVNQSMAGAVWPGENPIDRNLLGLCGDGPVRVVGVVGDVRHLTPEQASGNELYLPALQCRDAPSVDLVLRSDIPAPELAAVVRRTLRPVVTNINGNEYRALQDLVDKVVSPRRFVVMLLGGFAVFALVLASLGTYALISYSVGQRTREIGIRMALGASAHDVQFGIVVQTMALAAAGLLVGGVASKLLAGSLGGLLFEVTPGDPVTFLAMIGILAGVAAIAGYLPARRASRTDPLTALRSE